MMKRFSGVIFRVLTMFFMALTPAFAQQQPMAFPLDCQAGQSCWIIGYPDLSGDAGVAKDFKCGPGATDNDVFLRLGLPDAGTIPLDMRVLAIDDGVVMDATDGVSDIVASSKANIKAGTPTCGNGVVIKHASGMESVYCHMRRNSIAVESGEQVQKGQTLGVAGQSGIALWPQLGFALRKGGYFLDPITSATIAEGCGMKGTPVMTMPYEFTQYQPVAIVSLGFANGPVSAQAMALGKAVRFAGLNSEEKAINLWGMILGVRKGDRIEIRLRDPRGRTFYYTDILADADAARMPVNAVRERGYSRWRAGLYTGELTVTRKIGVVPYSVSRSVTLEVE
jgi:hypothetical protein